MNKYIKFIQDLLEDYNAQNEAWKEKVALANANVAKKNDQAYQFVENKVWFYSGDLIDENNLTLKQGKKYVFLTMNPRLDEKPPKFLEVNDFIKEQNKLFESYKTRHPMSYEPCEKLIRLIENEEIEAKETSYPLLNKYAVVIDWFPFYSENFSIKMSNNLPYEFLQVILEGIQELKDVKIFAIGTDIKDVLLQLSLKQPNIQNISDKYQSFLETEQMQKMKIFQYNEAQKIFTFSLAPGEGRDNNYYEDLAEFFKNI